MGSEANSTTSSPSASPARSSTPVTVTVTASGKRSRDPEDEVYLDNLHSHKRYLSEIMASSLNGLTVGDSLSDTLMESSSASDNLFFLRDDMSLQYSPISEDSEDSRYSETPINSCSSQPESQPSSPVSPYRFQRPPSTFSYGTTTTSSPPHGNTLPAATSSQPRQRGSDSEGRFPSSPSDICHSGDLRRTALLRSVHMRAQPLGQESLHSMEIEERPCSFMKSLVDERDNQNDECSSYNIISHGEFNGEKPGGVLNVNTRAQPRGQESMHSMETEERPCSTSIMKSLVDERDNQNEECSLYNIISDGEFNGEKPGGVLNVNTRAQPRGQESMHGMETEERPCSTSIMKSLVDERESRVEECSSFNIPDGEFNGVKSGGISDVNMKKDEAEDRMT